MAENFKEVLFNLIRLQEKHNIKECKLEFKIPKLKKRYTKNNRYNKMYGEDFVLQSNCEPSVINDYLKNKIIMKENFYKYLSAHIFRSDMLEEYNKLDIYLDNKRFNLNVKYILKDNSFFVFFKIIEIIENIEYNDNLFDKTNYNLRNKHFDLFSEKDQVRILEENNIEYQRDNDNFIIICHSLSDKKLIWPQFDSCDLYHEKEPFIVYVKQNTMIGLSVINNKVSAFSTDSNLSNGPTQQMTNFNLYFHGKISKKFKKTINQFKSSKIEIRNKIIVTFIPIIFSLSFFILFSHNLQDIIEFYLGFFVFLLILSTLNELESDPNSPPFLSLSMLANQMSYFNIFACSSIFSVVLFKIGGLFF